MSSNDIWNDYRIAAMAAIVVDKLENAKDDSWALAAELGSHERPLWRAFLWTIPQLGSSQLMAAGFPMGEAGVQGIVVGDGHRLSSINPILVEWLFNQHTLPSGSCLFASVSSGEKFTNCHGKKLGLTLTRNHILTMSGLPLMTCVIVFLLSTTSISFYSVIFCLSLYLATLVSNLYLATQSQHLWAGYTKDSEEVDVLLIAPGDRWAVLSGPRNLIKIITTGTHVNQRPSILRGAGKYNLIAVILSAAFLEAASLLDGALIALSILSLHLVAQLRARRIGNAPIIRGVRIAEHHTKLYQRRADLVTELSSSKHSDCWAYESGLLTRQYIPGERRLGADVV